MNNENPTTETSQEQAYRKSVDWLYDVLKHKEDSLAYFSRDNHNAPPTEDIPADEKIKVIINDITDMITEQALSTVLPNWLDKSCAISEHINGNKIFEEQSSAITSELDNLLQSTNHDHVLSMLAMTPSERTTLFNEINFLSDQLQADALVKALSLVRDSVKKSVKEKVWFYINTAKKLVNTDSADVIETQLNNFIDEQVGNSRLDYLAKPALEREAIADTLETYSDLLMGAVTIASLRDITTGVILLNSKLNQISHITESAVKNKLDLMIEQTAHFIKNDLKQLFISDVIYPTLFQTNNLRALGLIDTFRETASINHPVSEIPELTDWWNDPSYLNAMRQVRGEYITGLNQVPGKNNAFNRRPMVESLPDGGIQFNCDAADSAECLLVILGVLVRKGIYKLEESFDKKQLKKQAKNRARATRNLEAISSKATGHIEAAIAVLSEEDLDKRAAAARHWLAEEHRFDSHNVHNKQRKTRQQLENSGTVIEDEIKSDPNYFYREVLPEFTKSEARNKTKRIIEIYAMTSPTEILDLIPTMSSDLAQLAMDHFIQLIRQCYPDLQLRLEYLKSTLAKHELKTQNLIHQEIEECYYRLAVKFSRSRDDEALLTLANEILQNDINNPTGQYTYHLSKHIQLLQHAGNLHRVRQYLDIIDNTLIFFSDEQEWEALKSWNVLAKIIIELSLYDTSANIAAHQLIIQKISQGEHTNLALDISLAPYHHIIRATALSLLALGETYENKPLSSIGSLVLSSSSLTQSAVHCYFNGIDWNLVTTPQALISLLAVSHDSLSMQTPKWMLAANSAMNEDVFLSLAKFGLASNTFGQLITGENIGAILAETINTKLGCYLGLLNPVLSLLLTIDVAIFIANFKHHHAFQTNYQAYLNHIDNQEVAKAYRVITHDLLPQMKHSRIDDTAQQSLKKIKQQLVKLALFGNPESKQMTIDGQPISDISDGEIESLLTIHEANRKTVNPEQMLETLENAVKQHSRSKVLWQRLLIQHHEIVAQKIALVDIPFQFLQLALPLHFTNSTWFQSFNLIQDIASMHFYAQGYAIEKLQQSLVSQKLQLDNFAGYTPAKPFTKSNIKQIFSSDPRVSLVIINDLMQIYSSLYHDELIPAGHATVEASNLLSIALLAPDICVNPLPVAFMISQQAASAAFHQLKLIDSGQTNTSQPNVNHTVSNQSNWNDPKELLETISISLHAPVFSFLNAWRSLGYYGLSILPGAIAAYRITELDTAKRYVASGFLFLTYVSAWYTFAEDFDMSSPQEIFFHLLNSNINNPESMLATYSGLCWSMLHLGTVLKVLTPFVLLRMGYDLQFYIHHNRKNDALNTAIDLLRSNQPEKALSIIQNWNEDNSLWEIHDSHASRFLQFVMDAKVKNAIIIQTDVIWEYSLLHCHLQQHQNLPLALYDETLDFLNQKNINFTEETYFQLAETNQAIEDYLAFDDIQTSSASRLLPSIPGLSLYWSFGNCLLDNIVETINILGQYEDTLFTSDHNFFDDLVTFDVDTICKNFDSQFMFWFIIFNKILQWCSTQQPKTTSQSSGRHDYYCSFYQLQGEGNHSVSNMPRLGEPSLRPV